MEYKLPKRVEKSNKSTYGRVLNIAGSDYMSGAAYLSSVSSLKIGCGYVFLCSGERVIDSVAAKTSNVVFMPVKNLKKELPFFDVYEIGCGLGQSYSAKKIFYNFIKNVPKNKPIIFDADALNIVSSNRVVFRNSSLQNVVFTPHPKEAARLLNVSCEDVIANIPESAKKISKIYNCVTVLKTHQTYICSPEGSTYTNSTGNNSMAKAGSGDVLTGIISGLIAQGMDLFEGACLGAYLHGLCGDIAKNRLTEYSVMAEDLISSIPEAIKLYSKN